MSEFEFKAGDRVKCVFFGDKTFTLTQSISGLCVFVEHEGHFFTFLKDGRYSTHHTHPSITLVERPKTKHTVSRYVNVYASDNSRDYDTYTTRADADKYAGIVARIACVELKGEYEI